MSTLADIAAQFGGEVRGDSAVRIRGVGSLSGALPDQIAFYESEAHRPALLKCRAGAVLLSAADADACDLPRWVVPKNPRLHFARLAQWLSAKSPADAAISPHADVAPDAAIGANVSIGPFASIGAGARIGDDCVIGASSTVGAGAEIGARTVLMARSVLYAGAVVGEECLIHSGAVIGADGFGFVRDESGRQIKIPQLGGVLLGSRVEVGANSAIDRGALDDTVIEDGVKIDNLVQIGHNVHVGENTVICGCVGIAGSARIGKNCMLGGGAGIIGHLTVGDGAMVAACANVTRAVRPGETVSSMFSAMPIRRWRRFVAALKIMAGKRAE